MDTSKIIKGVVGGGRYTVTAPIIKEDYGLYLQIEGVELPQTYEVDFSNSEHSGMSVTMIGNSDGVLIPHQFIDTGKDVFAFLYHVGANYGRTVYKFRIPNKVRPDRTDEQPTPEEQSVIDQAISALNTAVAQTAQDVIDADASAQSASADADRAEQAKEDASTFAQRSANSAQASADYSESAQASATASANSASQSAQIKADVEELAEDAQGYANASEQSATASANSAEQAESAKGVAQSYAQDAQTSATYASLSESTASTKASEASGYASTASQKATEASQSASQASGYAQTAETAKTDAQTAKTQAETARDNAVTAKTAAETAQGKAEDAQAAAESVAESIPSDYSQLSEDVSDLKEDLLDIKPHDALFANLGVVKNVLNRFDKSTIHAGKYIDISNGNLKDNSIFFASDYIYIGDLTSVKISYTHLFGWYDVNKAWLGHPDTMATNPADGTYIVPEGAVYLRFSNYNYNLNLSQIGADVSRNNYIPYGLFTIPDYYEGLKPVIVDASGNGDYTSFTQAIYKTKNSGRDVIVRAGTYDIEAEYVALFGQTAIDEMSDSSDMNGFQRGISLDNRKITFESGAHLVCDWSNYTVNGTHRFCAFDIGVNVELVGLDLDCTGTWYCIHDDRGTNDYAYTNKYENCRVIGHSLKNGQCIGGGCKKYSRHIINNCYLNNNSDLSGTLRYHNTNLNGAEPEVYVSNTYIKTTFTPRFYGNQTTKMKVYVNNCEARSIHKLAESSSFNVDNVDLYKWCNTETDPAT